MTATGKAINSHTSNEFHRFQRRALRMRLTDIDAWHCVCANGEESRPVALYELKRSFIAVEAWRPFADDWQAYAALLGLARRADVPLFVVYFRKGIEIEDDTPMAVFRLESVRPFSGYRKVMTGAEFAVRFPILTGPPS